MVLADRMQLANTRQLLRAFGGLNETYGCSEAEYSAGVNYKIRRGVEVEVPPAVAEVLEHSQRQDELTAARIAAAENAAQ